MLILALLAGSAFACDELREINGVTLSVKEAGEGPAVIMIHGRGYAKEYMDSIIDHYKDKYHAFGYDTRGHGKSERPASFTLDDDADDLAGLIAAYGLHKPAAIGFSMGSYITLKAAEKHPDLFSKIELIGTRYRGDRYEDEDASSMTDIKKAIVPALVITDENDKTNPVSEGRKVAEALPDARFHVIPNAEHVAFMKPEGLEMVCSLIDDFLTVKLTYSDH